MKTHLPGIIAGLSALAVLTVSGYAAETGDPGLSARVRLAVAAPDSIKAALIGHLNKALRSLDRVELVDQAPEFEINVVALEIRSTRGYRGGVAISTVILSRFQNEAMSRRDSNDPVQAQMSRLWFYPGHDLQVDALDRLEIMCKQIVTNFDTNHLEKNRRTIRESRGVREKAR